MLKKLTVTAITGMLAFGAALPAQSADVTLRFAHHFPAVAGAHKNIFQPWAEKVSAESNGKIEVQLFPSGTLAKPPSQYEAVKNRIADVTATIQGYTANRFPLTQVVELPGLVKSAAHGSCVLQTLYDEGHLDEEYKDTKPLFLFTHGPGLIHTKDKIIKEPTDLAGMRIRRPTAVVANILKEVKAQPVGMPAPTSYQSMQRGVIDGASFPWEGALVFRLNELAKAHTEVGGLYTLSFIVTMNKSVYDDLSPDLKKVIDNNSGKEWSARAAKDFDRLDRIGRENAVKDGHEIFTVEDGTENPAWKPILERAKEAYLTDLEARGLPARKVYARAKEIAQSCL